jgi:YCII-related domain
LGEITDEYMRENLGKTRPYTLVIIHKTAKLKEQGMDKVVWEHGRRNFQLRKDGKLNLVGPIRDESDVCGFYIFPVGLDEVRKIMDGDPGVQAGIFTYEIHPAVSFPGDALA